MAVTPPVASWFTIGEHVDQNDFLPWAQSVEDEIDAATGGATAGGAYLENRLADGGRFLGVPEPTFVGTGVPAALPLYFTPFNGATFTLGDRFFHNNSTFGGTGPSLSADMTALVEYLTDTSISGRGRFGVEFVILNVTAGAGTSGPVNVGGTNYYLVYSLISAPIPEVTTAGLIFRRKTGGVMVRNLTTSYLDGVELTGNHVADGNWHTLARIKSEDVTTRNVPYDATLFPVYATPGATLQIALPFVHFGDAKPAGRQFNAVPSTYAFGAP